jgi:hypothetical protein
MTERGLDSETCCYQQSKMVDNVQCGSVCQFSNYVALDCIYLDEHEHTTKTSAKIGLRPVFQTRYLYDTEFDELPLSNVSA